MHKKVEWDTEAVKKAIEQNLRDRGRLPELLRIQCGYSLIHAAPMPLVQIVCSITSLGALNALRNVRETGFRETLVINFIVDNPAVIVESPGGCAQYVSFVIR